MFALNGGQYVYTAPDGRQSVFNSDGLMVKWVGTNGLESFTFAYTNADGDAYTDELLTVTNPGGVTATFAYDTGGSRVTSVTGPGGLSVTFAYSTMSGVGDLTQVTKAAGGPGRSRPTGTTSSPWTRTAG